MMDKDEISDANSTLEYLAKADRRITELETKLEKAEADKKALSDCLRALWRESEIQQMWFCEVYPEFRETIEEICE